MSKPKKFVIFKGRKHYSESFKKHVVREVESGKISKEEARHKYNILGNSAVLNWCRTYGKLNNYKFTRQPTMSNEAASEKAYKRRIKELESELSNTKLRVSYLESVIEVAEEMGIFSSKKFVAQPSENVKRKKK